MPLQQFALRLAKMDTQSEWRNVMMETQMETMAAMLTAQLIQSTLAPSLLLFFLSALLAVETESLTIRMKSVMTETMTLGTDAALLVMRSMAIPASLMEPSLLAISDQHAKSSI